MPGLHLARRVDQASSFGWAVAMPDFYACGVADGPKSWRERFADGARLLSSDAAPTVVETEIQTLMESFGRVDEGRTWWSLACLREDGAATEAYAAELLAASARVLRGLMRVCPALARLACSPPLHSHTTHLGYSCVPRRMCCVP